MTEELILPFFRSMGLDGYLLDPEVSELMITNGLVFVERAGKITEIEGIQIDERKLRAGVEIIGRSIGDEIDDYFKPWLDSRFPDGSRVAAAYPPMSPQGVLLTIRKFLRHFTTDELLERGALTSEVLKLILIAVRGRKNILGVRRHIDGQDHDDECLRAAYPRTRANRGHREASRNEARSSQ